MVQVQEFRIDTRYGFEILHQRGKRVKTKSHKVLEANWYVSGSYRGKAGRGGLFGGAPPPILNRVKDRHRKKAP